MEVLVSLTLVATRLSRHLSKFTLVLGLFFEFANAKARKSLAECLVGDHFS